MGDGRPAEVSAFVLAAGRGTVRVRGDLGTGSGEDAGELRDPDDGTERGRAAVSSPDAGAPAGGADAAVDWERAAGGGGVQGAHGAAGAGAAAGARGEPVREQLPERGAVVSRTAGTAGKRIPETRGAAVGLGVLINLGLRRGVSS